MRIPVKGLSEDGNTKQETPEWSMIELNGELVIPQTTNDESNPLGKDQVELGSLKFKEGTPVMTVGSHELKGKVVTLKEPFAVLKKRKREEDDQVEYKVLGVVTKKLLFDQYPKSIMR
mmetsp:Transcript_21632/g.49933  ORF Transcript_21632/g.49933 Transcript_21632/m.49933 type:complete len:118 (+) Transcript_21632:66-419(+)